MSPATPRTGDGRDVGVRAGRPSRNAKHARRRVLRSHDVRCSRHDAACARDAVLRIVSSTRRSRSTEPDHRRDRVCQLGRDTQSSAPSRSSHRISRTTSTSCASLHRAPSSGVQSLDKPILPITDPSVDAVFLPAERGSAWTLMFPEYSVVVPGPEPIRVPLAFPIGKRDEQFARFINTWIALKRKDATLDAGVQTLDPRAGRCGASAALVDHSQRAALGWVIHVGVIALAKPVSARTTGD